MSYVIQFNAWQEILIKAVNNDGKDIGRGWKFCENQLGTYSKFFQFMVSIVGKSGHYAKIFSIS